jgi:hypothetical protein
MALHMPKSKRRVSVLVAPPAVAAFNTNTHPPVAKIEPKVPSFSRPLKILISAYVSYHLIGIGLWLLPPTRFQQVFVEYFRPYINMAAMWQSWSVFAPVPKTWNLYCSARIYYKDGTTSDWTFPRIDKLSLTDRMVSERYRKWVSEGLVDPKNSIIWPDCARWVLRNHAHKGKVPIAVDLIKHWAYIEPPETGLGKPSPEPNQHYAFYRYRVAAGIKK